MPEQTAHRKRIKRRFVAGGLVAGLVALVMWLASLLPGWGLGLGSGAGLGTGKSGDDAEKSRIEREPPPAREPQDESVVVIRVEGNRYKLQKRIGGKVEYTPIDVPRIVELAEAAPGDRQGLKVRVDWLGNNEVGTRRRLVEAFRDAGLRPHEYRIYDVDFQ